MVSGRTPLLEEVELALFLKFVIYEYPCAVPVFIDFALALVLPTAWPVDEALSAAGDGAYRACEFQYAVPARRTPLQK